MNIQNEFTVSSPIEEVWDAMLDLERVTPGLQGAALTEEVGDEYKGTMSIKLGPVSAKYNGTVKYSETDEANRKAVIQADGKDARGQGTASATITSTLHDEGGGSTRVVVETEMKLTGKVAQFGRGVQKDVAAKIMGNFADCLENNVFQEEIA
ncbi:MAG: SRPBCC family protein [Actinomycetota bacterium]|jgi:carbon monoxide dehydrogenase subunit G|nr:SRPBCC family protein [Rubrobacter sp.]MDQ3506635.1 SRPBCC family protein [Actinomycetota bacterium]